MKVTITGRVVPGPVPYLVWKNSNKVQKKPNCHIYLKGKKIIKDLDTKNSNAHPDQLHSYPTSFRF